MMTVKELKELLETLPEDWTVGVFEGTDFEEGYAYADNPDGHEEVKLF